MDDMGNIIKKKLLSTAKKKEHRITLIVFFRKTVPTTSVSHKKTNKTYQNNTCPGSQNTIKKGCSPSRLLFLSSKIRVAIILIVRLTSRKCMFQVQEWPRLPDPWELTITKGFASTNGWNGLIPGQITWQPLGPLLKVKLLVGPTYKIPRSTQRSGNREFSANLRHAQISMVS